MAAQKIFENIILEQSYLKDHQKGENKIPTRYGHADIFRHEYRDALIMGIFSYFHSSFSCLLLGKVWLSKGY